MTVNIVTGSMLKGLREAGCRITTICKCKGYIIGERAKRARHSQVCSIENRGYIYYSANEAKLTNRRENCFKFHKKSIKKSIV